MLREYIKGEFEKLTLKWYIQIVDWAKYECSLVLPDIYPLSVKMGLVRFYWFSLPLNCIREYVFLINTINLCPW